MKKSNVKNRLSAKTIVILALVMAAFLAVGVLIGSFVRRNASSGTLILSVNPIIRIDYDQNGNVTAVSGQNADGVGIVENAGSLVGLECKDAVRLLVEQIHSAGYFVDEIEGERRNVYLRSKKALTSQATASLRT